MFGYGIECNGNEFPLVSIPTPYCTPSFNLKFHSHLDVPRYRKMF